MAAISEQYKHLNILEVKKIKVFISGQKYFGLEIFRLCNSLHEVEIVGVCTPVGDKYLGKIAATFGIPIIPGGSLNYETMPEDVDLGITAHSFDYVGKRTRYKTRLGWLGYHPSLLPRHRGRSAIEWAIRMGDPVTGGTIFWLNAGIDRGDIAYQDWCFIDPHSRLEPKQGAKQLWEDKLLPMGVKLYRQALNDIAAGIIKKRPQESKYSTFEPSTAVKDVYRPDLLMLEENASPST